MAPEYPKNATISKQYQIPPPLKYHAPIHPSMMGKAPMKYP